MVCVPDARRSGGRGGLVPTGFPSTLTSAYGDTTTRSRPGSDSTGGGADGAVTGIAEGDGTGSGADESAITVALGRGVGVARPAGDDGAVLIAGMITGGDGDAGGTTVASAIGGAEALGEGMEGAFRGHSQPATPTAATASAAAPSQRRR